MEEYTLTEAHKQSIAKLLEQLRALDTHTADRFRDMNVTWVWAQTTLDHGPGADRAYIAAEYERMYPRPTAEYEPGQLDTLTQDIRD